MDVAHGSLRGMSSLLAFDSDDKPPLKLRYKETLNNLGEIAVAHVNLGHALQPGAAKLRGAGVGVGQAVLEIHQHFRVLLVLLHLGRGHQDRSDPFGQVLHLSRKRSVL